MKTRHTVNPFNFETPADRRSFTDRETLLPRLHKIMEQPRQRALVFGRRRMGKTSLIKFAAHAAKRPFGFVDLSTATNLREVAKKLLSSVPISDDGNELAKTLKILKGFKSMAIKAGVFALEAGLREPPEETLDQVLAFLNAYSGATSECLVICMDEFQEIRSLSGPKAEWHLRGIIQHHEYLSYIFSGSDHRLLHWMTEPNAAFYKQLELIEVGPIDPPLLCKWITERCRIGGLPDVKFADAIVATAGPCTGDIVRLAKQVFEFAAEQRPGNVVAIAFDTIALGYLAPEFNALWQPLAATQRSLLRAIANGQSPFSAATAAEYSLTLGAVSTAQNALFDKQLLTRIANHSVFDSPFFQRWVAANSDSNPKHGAK